MKLTTAWLKAPTLARFAWGLLALIAGLGPALAEAAEERLFGQGRLWQITRDGLAPSHLFGTMHTSEASVAAPPPTQSVK